MADIALAGVWFAHHYAVPTLRRCVVPHAPLRKAASATAEMVSELLAGEQFAVLDATAQWLWGYCLTDHYVGFLDPAALGDDSVDPYVFRVHCREAGGLFMGSLTDRPLDGCTRAIDDYEDDWIAVAERLIGAPYLWGGRTVEGVDCSGLVQLALGLCGIAAPRDTDLQMAALGRALADDTPSARGDLIFFDGHVGMMVDGDAIIHAAGSHGGVVVEPLADVVARKAGDQGGAIIARKRIG